MIKSFMTMLVILMTSFSAFAGSEFTGIWSGRGEAIDSQGAKYSECSFNFSITQTDKSFTINSGSYHCGFVKVYRTFTMEIINNELYFEGNKVGTIADGHLYAVESNAASTSEYHLHATENQLSFEEKIVFTNNPQEPLTVKGILGRVQPISRRL